MTINVQAIQPLGIISINIWQILISLCNLLILFLLLKKFLYKPVKKVLAERQAAVDNQYTAADEARRLAESDRDAYAEKIAGAQAQADAIVRESTESARKRSDQIIADAREKATQMVRQAEQDVVLEHRKAEAGMRQEIVDVSALLTEKLLQREIRTDDHQALIESFLGEFDEQ